MIPVKKRYIDEGENLGSQLADEKRRHLGIHQYIHRP